MSRRNALRFIHSATGRLAMTYLAIIMLMSIGFSIVFYNTSSQQLGRQIPPPTLITDGPTGRFSSSSRQTIEAFLESRVNEGRQALLRRLIGLNLLALLGGSVISYYLARRSLEPIEQAMEAQEQFVSDASHELRTPLTAIKSSNEVALRKTKLSLHEAKQVIEQNTEDIAKLQALTDNLLSLANKDHAPTLQPVNLQDVTADAINNVIKLAQAKDIIIDDQTSAAEVLANHQSLSQALTVLFDNAIKYSGKGTVIKVSNTQHGQFAQIDVEDQGIGIRASDLPHIFQRFYRADRSRTKAHQDGYGLGLAIASQLIEQQNGKISAQSKPGKGSTFSVQLPFA